MHRSDTDGIYLRLKDRLRALGKCNFEREGQWKTRVENDFLGRLSRREGIVITMGKGFEIFMKNDYWKEQYKNAPTDNLKEYYEMVFETSPFVVGDNVDVKLVKRAKELCKMFGKEEVEYLAKYAVGGQEKVFYRKWLLMS